MSLEGRESGQRNGIWLKGPVYLCRSSSPNLGTRQYKVAAEGIRSQIIAEQIASLLMIGCDAGLEVPLGST